MKPDYSPFLDNPLVAAVFLLLCVPLLLVILVAQVVAVLSRKVMGR